MTLERTARTCHHCGDTFRRDISRGSTDRRDRFCKDECRLADLRGPVHVGTEDARCRHCRKWFKRKVGLRGRPRVYHSYKCSKQASRAARAERR